MFLFRSDVGPFDLSTIYKFLALSTAFIDNVYNIYSYTYTYKVTV